MFGSRAASADPPEVAARFIGATGAGQAQAQRRIGDVLADLERNRCPTPRGDGQNTTRLRWRRYAPGRALAKVEHVN